MDVKKKSHYFLPPLVVVVVVAAAQPREKTMRSSSFLVGVPATAANLSSV